MGWAPFPNYLGLPSNMILDYPGPAIINAPNSPYRHNPSFDGFYAHNTQTSPYLNYLFDIVNGVQNEAFQATQNIGNGFYPLPAWPQQQASSPISQGWGAQAYYPYQATSAYTPQVYGSPYAGTNYAAFAPGYGYSGMNSFYI